MGQYRIEVSPNSRAGCKDTKCKKEGIKIQKGELRLASQVEIQERVSWMYKHWGCTTPKVISNVKEAIEDDIDLFDGYDELSEDVQEKVRRAIESGHVDDDDWRGDPELNRPGQRGVHKPVRKSKKSKAQDDDDGANAGESNPSPKKRGRSAKEDDEIEAPAPKMAKSRSKKAKVEEAGGDDDAAEVKDVKKKTKVKTSKAEPKAIADAVPPKDIQKAPTKEKANTSKRITRKEDTTLDKTTGPKKGRKKAEVEAEPVEKELDAEDIVEEPKSGRGGTKERPSAKKDHSEKIAGAKQRSGRARKAR